MPRHPCESSSRTECCFLADCSTSVSRLTWIALNVLACYYKILFGPICCSLLRRVPSSPINPSFPVRIIPVPSRLLYPIMKTILLGLSLLALPFTIAAPALLSTNSDSPYLCQFGTRPLCMTISGTYIPNSTYLISQSLAR